MGFLHVDAGGAEEVEGPLGAAAFEEGEVVVEFCGAAFEDALGEGDGGGEAGGVFVDVEGAVEVGDAEAFEFEVGVDDEGAFFAGLVAAAGGDAEVEFEEFTVFGAEEIDGEGFAFFDMGVGDFFELGEHGLADDGAADFVDGVVDEVGFFFFGFRAVDEVFEEELFVEGAGDFGDEDGVAIVLIGLVVRRVPGVHGVAGFVGEGEDMVEDFGLVVHHDVGRAVEAAGGEGAGGFTGVGVAVGPACGGEAFVESFGVFGAEGGEGVGDGLCGLFPGVVGVDAGDDGGVGVVHADVGDFEGAFAEGEVAVVGGEMLVDGGDEGVVDGDGHVVLEEGGFAGAGKVAGLGVVGIALDAGVDGGGQGVFVGLVLGVVGVECFLADALFGGVEEFGEGGVAELDAAAFFILDYGPFEVGVVELAEGVVGAFGHLAGHGEELLFAVGEGVGAVAEDAFEGELPGGEEFGFEELVHLGGGDFEEFGADEAGGFAGFGDEVVEAAGHALVDGVAVVAGGLEGGVVAEAFGGAFEVGFELEEVGEGLGGFCEFAFEGGEGGDLGFPLFEILFPGGVGGVEGGEVPLIGEGDILAFGEGVGGLGHENSFGLVPQGL